MRTACCEMIFCELPGIQSLSKGFGNETFLVPLLFLGRLEVVVVVAHNQGYRNYIEKSEHAVEANVGRRWVGVPKKLPENEVHESPQDVGEGEHQEDGFDSVVLLSQGIVIILLHGDHQTDDCPRENHTHGQEKRWRNNNCIHFDPFSLFVVVFVPIHCNVESN